MGGVEKKLKRKVIGRRKREKIMRSKGGIDETVR